MCKTASFVCFSSYYICLHWTKIRSFPYYQHRTPRFSCKITSMTESGGTTWTEDQRVQRHLSNWHVTCLPWNKIEEFRGKTCVFWQLVNPTIYLSQTQCPFNKYLRASLLCIFLVKKKVVNMRAEWSSIRLINEKIMVMVNGKFYGLDKHNSKCIF